MKRRCVPKKIDKYYLLSFLIILIIVLGYLCFHGMFWKLCTPERKTVANCNATRNSYRRETIAVILGKRIVMNTNA